MNTDTPIIVTLHKTKTVQGQAITLDAFEAVIPWAVFENEDAVIHPLFGVQ